MQALLQMRIKTGEEDFVADYSTIEECLADDYLPRVLGLHGCSCSIWIGELRITRDVQTMAALEQELVRHSSRILQHALLNSARAAVSEG